MAVVGLEYGRKDTGIEVIEGEVTPKREITGFKLIKQSMKIMDYKSKIKNLTDEFKLQTEELESRQQYLLESQERRVGLEERLKEIQTFSANGFGDIIKKFDKLVSENSEKNNQFAKLDREFETVKLQLNFLCNDTDLGANPKLSKIASKNGANPNDVSKLTKDSMQKVIHRLDDVQSKFLKNSSAKANTVLDELLMAIQRLSNNFNAEISVVKSRSESQLLDLSTDFAIGGDFGNTS